MIKQAILVICILFSLLVPQSASAQYAFFADNGTVTYERKLHLHNYIKTQLKRTDQDHVFSKMFLEDLLKNGPAEVVTKNTLKFSDQETFFENLVEEYPASYRNIIRNREYYSESKTYVNFKNKTFKKLLPFGDDELLMVDSIPTVKWKFTNEYRTIAGYDCRRVNGVIQDSIYVVAFYTPQIPISGGPELINGLPGMILGVAIPELNLNYFASKVELNNSPVPTSLTKNKKIVPETKQQATENLKKLMSWLSNRDFMRMFL
ncbi:GLPGLI family protein [Sphingobacterium sp. SYP-B4668]|uniref:GLPGLI family protein n=1 Tax=Sphingobacterium sp. SYP-B4668 TaxID=2996035 RepID=UPI0022DE87DC|nr:GLPGLI family protein [Sphingobacterium sp. SYP-B4668]